MIPQGPDTIFHFKRGAKASLSENFTTDEFECKCGECIDQKVDLRLVAYLQYLRNKHGPIFIVSGHRCPKWNKQVGGADDSTHLDGMGVDFKGLDNDALYQDCPLYFKAIGDGRMHGFIHGDTRSDKIRRWSY